MQGDQPVCRCPSGTGMPAPTNLRRILLPCPHCAGAGWLRHDALPLPLGSEPPAAGAAAGGAGQGGSCMVGSSQLVGQQSSGAGAGGAGQGQLHVCLPLLLCAQPCCRPAAGADAADRRQCARQAFVSDKSHRKKGGPLAHRAARPTHSPALALVLMLRRSTPRCGRTRLMCTSMSLEVGGWAAVHRPTQQCCHGWLSSCVACRGGRFMANMTGKHACCSANCRPGDEQAMLALLL